MEYNISFITGSPLVAVYYTYYTCVCVCVCVCARSWRAWPYSELRPRSALRTVVDGPPCQTLSLSYHSGPHTFKWTHFVITSSHRNIIEVSCAGTCLRLHMLLTQVCNVAPLNTTDRSPPPPPACFVAADEPLSGLFSQKIISCSGVFLEKYWRIMTPKMS